jgi:hypothetical protein
MHLTCIMAGSLSTYHLAVSVRRFSVEHGFNCSCDRFPSMRHNAIRDIPASLLTEVCHNVSVGLELQPLSGEQFQYTTANTWDGAHLHTQGF